MIDFLHYIFKYVVHDVGFIACIVFLALWNKLSKTETWVGLLLFGVFFLDLFAASFAYKNLNNQWIYNLGIPLQLLLIVIIFYQLFTAPIFKRNLMIGYGIFLILYSLDLLFIQKFAVLNTYVYIPACIGVAVISYLYLKSAIENIEIKPSDNFFFWFACATLINYTASVPLIALLTWPGISDPVWNKIYFISNGIDCCWFILTGGGLAWTKCRTSFSL